MFNTCTQCNLDTAGNHDWNCPNHPRSPATDDVCDSEGHCKTKEEVFEEILKIAAAYMSYICKWPAGGDEEWLVFERSRYAKAERFGLGHDVSDLYESPIEGQEEWRPFEQEPPHDLAMEGQEECLT